MAKQLQSSEMQRGACRFCGQLIDIETSGLAKEADLNEWATEKCNCSEAKAYTKSKKSLKEAKDKIVTFFEYAGPAVISFIDDGS